VEFFSSVFTKEPEGEIPNLQPKETKFRCAEHQIEEKEVLKLLLDINPIKSPGPDENRMFSGFIDTLMYGFSSTGVTIYCYFGLKFNDNTCCEVICKLGLPLFSYA
jgi:hypothetical protein